MIKVKGNYKNGHRDQACRLCKEVEENQQHVLNECRLLHQNDERKTQTNQIFTEDPATLKVTACQIYNTLEKLMMTND